MPIALIIPVEVSIQAPNIENPQGQTLSPTTKLSFDSPLSSLKFYFLLAAHAAQLGLTIL